MFKTASMSRRPGLAASDGEEGMAQACRHGRRLTAVANCGDMHANGVLEEVRPRIGTKLLWQLKIVVAVSCEEHGAGKERHMWDRCEWLNPPPRSKIGNDGVLSVITGWKTDFWQRTFYGFQRDDGHAFLQTTDAEFSATLTFDARYETLYDQAGLFLRTGPTLWAKFGIEYTDGAAHLSVVMTNRISDWSVTRLEVAEAMTVRATRLEDCMVLQRRVGDDWQMVRLMPWPGAVSVSVGPFVCSPERAGLVAQFSDFSVELPAFQSLH